MPHRRPPRPSPALLAVALLLGGATSPAGAQGAITPRWAVSLSAGVSQYDLSGTGTAPTGTAPTGTAPTGTAPLLALRGDLPLAPALLLEGGVALAFPSRHLLADVTTATTLVVPELGLQLQLPRRVAPYLGLGVGAAVDLAGERAGGTRTDLTLSGAGGVRAWLTDRVGVRGELRLRGIGTGFERSTAEWTLGLAWRP